MEGSSTFEQTADPFGEDGMGDFAQPAADPFAEAEVPAAEAERPKVVDREGNEVAAETDATQVASPEEQAELEAAQEAAAEAGIETAVEAAAEAAQPPAVEQPTPAEQPAQPEGQPTAEATQGASAPDPAAAGPTEGAAESNAEPGAAAGSDKPEPTAQQEADAAEPPKAKKGLRAYRLFTPEGTGKFAEVSWHEDKTGKVVEKGMSGARKQAVVMTRDQEGALAFGFTVVGSPEQGIKLVAVADSQWTVRHVQPDPVQPVRQRLKIR